MTNTDEDTPTQFSNELVEDLGNRSEDRAKQLLSILISEGKAAYPDSDAAAKKYVGGVVANLVSGFVTFNPADSQNFKDFVEGHFLLGLIGAMINGEDA